ncbi:hypothetical protein [Kribbella caucasensis]|uniref:hypothetical protein n=1 Tax=Kribbella caucasensis TaxID=2512215 RepID=UPI0014151AB6|nr:hypothetical protein [Kribbella sp. VKM Ac-2527]
MNDIVAATRSTAHCSYGRADRLSDSDYRWLAESGAETELTESSADDELAG